MKIELVNGTLSKSITRNDSGEVEVTVSGSNDSHGFGSGSHPVGGMNQTIVVEAKPLESVEAFGVKASSSNLVYAVIAVIVIIACWRLLKKWY